MSAGMSQINEAIKALVNNVNSFDLTKEKDAKKIKDMADGIVSSAEAVTKTDEFDEKRLEAVSKILELASKKAERYNPKDDTRAAGKAYREKRKDDAKKIEAARDARKDAVETIKKLKERYSQQAKVIEAYSKKYDPAVLESRLQARVDANERKIASNQAKLDAIRDFEASAQVTAETEKIKREVELKGKLEKLRKKVEDAKKLEQDISDIKTQGGSKETTDSLEEDLKDQKQILKEDAKRISSDYGIALNSSDLASLETSITNAKDTAVSNAEAARTKIIDLAKTSTEDYIKTDLHTALSAFATAEPQEILKVFESERHKLGTENLNLSSKNLAVSGTKTTLELGRTTIAAGNITPTIAEPTEAEIQDQINGDSTLKNALANVLSPEDRQQKVYEWLLNEKGKQPGFHPILSWKAKHSKKVIEQWENQYNKSTMDEARNRAKAKKQQDAANAPEAKATAKSQRTQTDFIKSLLHHTMTASDAQLNKMLKDAEKGEFGDTLDAVYTQLEDTEYENSK